MSVLPYFYGLEEPFLSLERQLFSPNMFHPFGMRSAHPWDMLTPMEQLAKRIGQLSVGRASPVDDEEKFQVSIDVQHFLPEEISVKVVEGQVIVEGNHEEKQDEHGYVSRKFIRRYALPKGCLPDTVHSKLSSDGVLIISAPKVLPLPSTGERIVPIIRTGPVQKQLSSPEPQLNEAPAKENN